MSVLPRIVQFALQVAIAWYLVPPIKRALPEILSRPYDIFIDAILLAIAVALVGHACAWVLKEIRKPSGGTLLACLGFALVLALFAQINAFTQAVETAIPTLTSNRFVYPLAGALAGYWIVS